MSAGINEVPRDHAVLNDLAITIRESSGTELARTAARLLTVIEGQYIDQLRTVDKDGLEKLQGKLAQTAALRALFAGTPHTDGTA